MRRVPFKLKWLFLALLLGALAIIPLTGASTYLVVFFFFLFMFVVLATSYDLVGGYLGYLNLGHSVFFGIGAYTFGVLFLHKVNLSLSFTLSAALPMLFAASISYPFFRLRGAYFALATFGLIRLLELLAQNLTGLTGGSGGLSIVSGFNLTTAYYAALCLVVAVVLTSVAVNRTKFGLALTSIREEEDVASALGVNAAAYKSMTLIISAFYAGIMGGIYMWYITYIHPSSVFGLRIALQPIVMAMLGGSGTVGGPVVGVVFLYFVDEFLMTKMAYLHVAVYGVIMTLVGLFMPGGIMRNARFKYFLKWVK